MSSTSPFAHLDGPAPMPVVGWRGNLVRFFNDPIGYMAPLPRPGGNVVPFVRGGAGPVLIREATSGSVFAFGAANLQAVWSQMAVYHSSRVPGPPESRSFERITAGLLNMNDERHRKQRRLIQPSFHKARIEGYHDTMVAFTERALAGFRTGEIRDLSHEMARLTLAVATKTLFGLDLSADSLSIGERIQTVLSLSLSPATFVPLNLPFTPRRRLIDASARLEQDLRQVIAQKRAAGLAGDDILATLLAARDEDGDALTDDELIGQLFILFLAGHDTTQSTVAWTLFLLAQHPAILADLLDELRTVLGGAAPSPEQIQRLPLLDRVIKESLRVLSPVPFTARLTVSPTVLGGVDLPTGTEVIISPHYLHREPDLYPEPQRFLPRRWEKLTPSPFEYAPFGAGPRMCIGIGFASLELKIILSILLQRFAFELPPAMRLDRHTTVVLSPKQGMPMTLRSPGSVPSLVRVHGNIREMVDLPQ